VIINEILSHQSEEELRVEFDAILAKCCELVLSCHERDPEYYGMVAACVVFPDGRQVYGINHKSEVGLRIHAEVAAIEACGDDIRPECTIVTTLSPCNQFMADRLGLNCDHIIKEVYGIEQVYCGYVDPTQEPMLIDQTNNPKLQELCKKFADTFLKENFHDGKVKGKSRPGRVKRAGASCAGSVSSLRAKARKYGGEKGKMYHWCANMKGGKKK
jgi:pyrimidine deaminase RibD-like protein